LGTPHKIIFGIKVGYRSAGYVSLRRTSSIGTYIYRLSGMPLFVWWREKMSYFGMAMGMLNIPLVWATLN
jgi:hypothetical protein